MKKLLLLLFIVFLTFVSSVKITGQFFGWDPLENTVASLGLLKSGTIADVEGKPTNLREPIPIIILAGHILLNSDINYSDSIKSIMSKRELRKQISRVNLYYVFGTLIFVLWLTIKLTKSFKLAFISIIFSWLFFLNSTQHLYSPHTEIIASMLLVLVTVLLINLYENPCIKNGVVVGIAMGLLSLTKMPATYVSIVVIPIIVIIIHTTKNSKFNRSLKLLAIITTAFSLTLSPWLIRNYYLSKSENNNVQSLITQRGGAILNDRANASKRVLNDVPGHLYVYSPMALKSSLFENILNFKRSDLWPGGKYDVEKFDRPDWGFKKEAIEAGRFHAPSDAITVSKLKQLEPSLKEFVNPKVMFEKDEEKQAKGIRTVLNRPLEIITSSLIYAYRGMWSFNGKSHPPESYSLYHIGNYLPYVILNFLCFIAFLLMPIFAIIKKKMEWFVFSLFGLGFFWIYALFSHFIPRYSAPLIPLTIVSILMILQNSFSRENK